MVKAGILSLKGDVCIFYCFTYTEGVLQQGTLFSQPYKILTKTMRTHKYLVIVAIEVEITGECVSARLRECGATTDVFRVMSVVIRDSEP